MQIPLPKSMTELTVMIAAIGALGTAAFGLVDAFKMLPGGGISRAGFKFIRRTIQNLAPKVASLDGSGLSPDSMQFTLLSQWINGTATTDQVNIAKSLIKLRLTPDTATALANATGVDANVLSQVAGNIRTGTALTTTQSDVYGRFDLLLTTMLDAPTEETGGNGGATAGTPECDDEYGAPGPATCSTRNAMPPASTLPSCRNATSSGLVQSEQ